ncbi:MAG TPA: hypothetical protein DIT83_08795 [Barnesiella intestinihominis]|uniref:hypothetical protein n=1 Tax=Barnesiella intestinihominis TaxID=487174 RepID=UPI000EC8ED2A|nr:hypothetical protein [Barnesiella intestinihominis]HCP43597.1 hypothetical protein [Barnesiella intestinihominis]
MERKVGEIFEYNGEWYQCIHTKSFGCENCNLTVQNNIHCIDAFKIRGECLSSNRKDGKSVIFKKLEKVGEPFVYEGKVLQRLRSIDGYSCVHCLFKEQACNFDSCDKDSFLVETELKLENMEEKKLNLKPFDFEAAKAGKPVCTRDGRKARIICFDTINKGNYPIIALLEDKGCEAIFYYNKDGKCNVGTERDLMMLPEKKEGWVNLCKNNYGDTLAVGVFPNREEAVSNCPPSYLGTIKIEWEE